MKNLYETLNVPEDASPDEIRKAFRALARRFHPDSGNGDESRFREITHAHEVLSRAESRRDYDRALRNFRARSGDLSSFAPPQFEVGVDQLGKILRELLRQGALTRVRIKRNGRLLLDLPFTAATALTTLGFVLAPLPTVLLNLGINRFLEMEVVNLVAERFESALKAHEAGRPADAERLYLECARMSEYFVPAHLNLGLLYRQLGEKKKAVERFRKVLEIAPFGEIGAAARRNLDELQGY
ncbi:MAG: DnaJ domain-containing protein [bacterium]